MSQTDPVVRVTDALGHDLLIATGDTARQMLDWLNLEDLAGELSDGLRELREMLRAQIESLL